MSATPLHFQRPAEGDPAMTDAVPAKPKVSNLAMRFASAGVAVPFILWALLFGPDWVWASFVLLFAIPIAGQELFAMTHAGAKLLQAWGILSTTATGILFYASTLSSWNGVARETPFTFGPGLLPWVPFMLLALLCGSLLLSLSKPLPSDAAGTRMAWLVAGPLYVGGLSASIASLHTLPHGGAWVVLSMMLAWFSDTAGYFAGRFLGGKIIAAKMSPNISPKKTWEGAVGGTLGALLGALLAHFWYLPDLPLGGAVALALVAGPLGILGDLVESLIKRSTGAKDSGWIVPGHGGLIDRVDALMFTATATVFYVRVFLS